MPKEYITIQGDMWDVIAKKTLGSEYFMTALIEANPQHRETVIFPANVRLTIPEIKTQISESLPPWKSGEVE
ncbi:tail protein X [Brevibacillus sp. H7]|uniref:tail protein X n=1 Tax=Brevibacillus sp. H7 TaxID=3349138 RepID=UPI0037F1F647